MAAFKSRKASNPRCMLFWRIRQRPRKGRGLSLGVLSKRFGSDRGNMRHLVQGMSRPCCETVKRPVDALEATVDEEAELYECAGELPPPREATTRDLQLVHRHFCERTGWFCTCSHDGLHACSGMWHNSANSEAPSSEMTRSLGWLDRVVCLLSA
jgi:hypothetical protein